MARGGIFARVTGVGVLRGLFGSGIGIVFLVSSRTVLVLTGADGVVVAAVLVLVSAVVVG